MSLTNRIFFYCILNSKMKLVEVAMHQQTFFIQFLDLCSKPIFGSSHGRTSIIALTMSILNSVIHTQRHIFDANNNCTCVCLSDRHQTNIFLTYCHIVYPTYANYKLLNVARISILISHDTLVSRFSYVTYYTTQHF